VGFVEDMMQRCKTSIPEGMGWALLLLHYADRQIGDTLSFIVMKDAFRFM